MPLGVIFDIDGTLVDSNDAHAASWVDALKEYGFADVSYDRIRRMMGMGGDKILPIVTGLGEDDGRGKALLERRTHIFLNSYLPHLNPFPGVRDLVLRIKQDGMITAVATSANKREMQRLLKVAGVEDLMDGTTSASDAEESKPDPDIINAAISKTGLRAEQMVMLGDTPYDVEAAGRAGIPIVAVRCGGWKDRELGGALAIYDDPADLLSNYEGSHLARPASK